MYRHIFFLYRKQVPSQMSVFRSLFISRKSHKICMSSNLTATVVRKPKESKVVLKLLLQKLNYYNHYCMYYKKYYKSPCCNHVIVSTDFLLPVLDVTFCGSTAVYRSYYNIKPGDEITVDYGYVYFHHPKEQRQSVLKYNYYFDCACKACKLGWPLLEKMDAALPR